MNTEKTVLVFVMAYLFAQALIQSASVTSLKPEPTPTPEQHAAFEGRVRRDEAFYKLTHP